MGDGFLSSHALTAVWAALSAALLGWPVWRLHQRLKRGQSQREMEAIQVATRTWRDLKKKKIPVD